MVDLDRIHFPLIPGLSRFHPFTAVFTQLAKVDPTAFPHVMTSFSENGRDQGRRVKTKPWLLLKVLVPPVRPGVVLQRGDLLGQFFQLVRSVYLVNSRPSWCLFFSSIRWR